MHPLRARMSHDLSFPFQRHLKMTIRVDDKMTPLVTMSGASTFHSP